MRNVILTLMICLMALPLSAQADDVRKIGADFLIDLGKKYHEAGDAQEAVHEFSKALLIDPNNAEAKKYLAEYGLSEGLYKPAKLKNSERISLGDQVNGFTQKISELEVDKLVLETTFDKLKQTNSQLLDENQKKDLKIKELEEKMTHLDQAFQSNSAVSDMARNLKQEDQVAVEAINPAESSEEAVAGPVSDAVLAQTPPIIEGYTFDHGNHGAVRLGPVYVLPQEKNTKRSKADSHLAKVVSALEDDLRLAQKEMINKDIALAKTQQETLHFVDEAIDANSKLVATKERYIKHLDGKAPHPVAASPDMKKQLLEAQDRVFEQDKILNDQYKHIGVLETDLREANDQVERLLDMSKK